MPTFVIPLPACLLKYDFLIAPSSPAPLFIRLSVPFCDQHPLSREVPWQEVLQKSTPVTVQFLFDTACTGIDMWW